MSPGNNDDRKQDDQVGTAVADFIDPGFRSRLSVIIGEKDPFSWAKSIGIPKGTFSRIWHQGSVPTAKHLRAIKKATGVSLDWLIAGEDLSEAWTSQEPMKEEPVEDSVSGIPQRLRHFRESNRWTQEYISRILGVSDTTYQNYEVGITSPPLEKIRHLRGLGLNFHWLITGAGAMVLEKLPLPDSDFPGIREDVLVESIRVLASVMSDLSIDLSPEAQARIISAIYDEHIVEGRAVSADGARRYLKLVVGG